jgi:hypothetical protein
MNGRKSSGESLPFNFVLAPVLFYALGLSSLKVFRCLDEEFNTCCQAGWEQLPYSHIAYFRCKNEVIIPFKCQGTDIKYTVRSVLIPAERTLKELLTFLCPCA